MRKLMRSLGFFLALFAMGNVVGYTAPSHYNETLPDPSAPAAPTIGAAPVFGGYDWGLTTDNASTVPIVIGNGVVFGKFGVAQSTTSATGAQSALCTPALLAAGSAAPVLAGSALCATTSASGVANVTICAATPNLSTVVGVAQAAASTGTVVNVCMSGFAFALTTGTVTAGDLETTSGLTAGFLSSNNSVLSTSTVAGIAMTAGNAAGGLTLIRLK